MASVEISKRLAGTVCDIRYGMGGNYSQDMDEISRRGSWGLCELVDTNGC